MNYDTSGSILFDVLKVIFTIFIAICFIIIFSKARQPEWAPLIPIYNLYCLSELTIGSGWFFLILIIPFVNVVFSFYMFYRLAIVFGKGTGFAIFAGFFPYIAVPIIAFGDAKYQGI